MVDFEIYTGQYKNKELKDSTVVKFRGQSLILLRPYIGVSVMPSKSDESDANIDTKTLDDNRVTLIARDSKNNFWPCIMRLTNGEAKQLITALKQAVKHDSSMAHEQFIGEIEP